MINVVSWKSWVAYNLRLFSYATYISKYIVNLFVNTTYIVNIVNICKYNIYLINNTNIAYWLSLY